MHVNVHVSGGVGRGGGQVQMEKESGKRAGAHEYNKYVTLTVLKTQIVLMGMDGAA